ncbi:MAG: RDD family protein [Methanomicrobiaceae archaeon]|nr:RDD family protein [Methanomicrobiaceae archaeon]
METLHLARWETRFWAWLIDFLLVSAAVSAVSGALRGVWTLPPIGMDFVSANSLILFAYWTILEGRSGQSIGKMVMNIRVTGRSGEAIGYATAALESAGKAFLLPLDALIGWFAMPGKKLRLFNRLSNTIVIATTYAEPENVRYVIEEE